MSAFCFSNSLPALALSHLQRRYRTLYSTATHNELDEVLRRPRFDQYLSLDRRLLLLRTFLDSSQLVEPHILIEVCRDPKDDKFLSLAVSSGSAVILTGDKDLLSLHPFRGIQILDPKQYLDALQPVSPR